MHIKNFPRTANNAVLEDIFNVGVFKPCQIIYNASDLIIENRKKILNTRNITLYIKLLSIILSVMND